MVILKFTSLLLLLSASAALLPGAGFTVTRHGRSAPIDAKIEALSTDSFLASSLRYSQLLENHGSISIIGVAARWKFPDGPTWSRCVDILDFAGLEVKPGGALLINPFYAGAVAPPAPLPGILEREAARFAALAGATDAPYTFTLDAAVFADGAVAGPDDLGFAEQMAARRQALSQVAALQPTELQALATTPPVGPGPSPALTNWLAIWRQRPAQALLRRPQVAAQWKQTPQLVLRKE